MEELFYIFFNYFSTVVEVFYFSYLNHFTTLDEELFYIYLGIFSTVVYVLTAANYIISLPLLRYDSTVASKLITINIFLKLFDIIVALHKYFLPRNLIPFYFIYKRKLNCDIV